MKLTALGVIHLAPVTKHLLGFVSSFLGSFTSVLSWQALGASLYALNFRAHILDLLQELCSATPLGQLGTYSCISASVSEMSTVLLVTNLHV